MLSGQTTNYAYDGDGNRALQTAGGQVTKFLWDTSHTLPQLALERDGAGSLLRRYLYGQRRISLSTLSATSYYHHDTLGSVANVTSATGVSQWTYAYEPFGATQTETLDDASAPQNPLRFTGELLDPTALYNLRARQYDSAAGRFIQRDPLEAGSSSGSVSVYAYAANRPLVFIDPSGEVFEPSSDGQERGLEVMSPSPVFGDGGGCSAVPGYPLGVIGGYNGGVAAHRAKARVPNWQSTNAIDVNVPVGARVCAIFAGTISATLGFGPMFNDGVYDGRRLHLVGRNDTAYYAHLSKVIVKRRQKVAKGDVLGFSGCSSNGVPHLHLALERGNPERYKSPTIRPVNYGC